MRRLIHHCALRVTALAAIVFIAAQAWFAVPAQARFAPGQLVPVERLIRNISAYVKEKPKDPQGYYLLARVHSLAFTLKRSELRAFEQANQKLPFLSPFQFADPNAKPKPPADDKLIEHLKLSIANFEKAIKLSPKNGLYRLGLAYTLETGAPWAGKVGVLYWPANEPVKLNDAQAAKVQALIAQLGDDDAGVRDRAEVSLRGQLDASVAGALVVRRQHKDAEVRFRVGRLLASYWTEQALAANLDAYKLSIKADIAVKYVPIRGLSELVSYEAGNSYVRLTKARGVKAGEKQQIAAVLDGVEKLKSKKRGPITPIIFSLTRTAPLSELLAPGRTVQFDLDGDGRVERRSWVQPDTAILVWDPTGKGQITSGRQLFGSVTFWMFWHDGYHAMDALDDNRDGELTGAELTGLAVWRDANGNGVSDAGEVRPVESLGIAALATRANTEASDAAGSPANRRGLRLDDGRVLPTYDWIAP